MRTLIQYFSEKLFGYLPIFITLALLLPINVFARGEAGSEDCVAARKILDSRNSDGDPSGHEKEILELCSDGAPGLFIKGQHLQELGKVEDAMELYRAALAADESIAEAHGNLGLLLLQEEKPGEAVVELTRGLMGKADPRYHAALADILRDQAPHLALFHYREAIKSYPGNDFLELGLAKALESTGRDVQAENLLKAILDSDDNNIAARIELAKILEKRGLTEEVLKNLTAAAAINPDNKEVHRLLGRAYRLKGEAEKADHEDRLAGITIDPEQYIDRGDSYLLGREYAKAIEQYQAAVRVRPQWLEALEKLGDAQRAAGNDEEAIVTFKQVIALDDTNTEIHYLLGALYERKGMLSEAAMYYQNALKHDAANGDARRRLADIYTLEGNFRLAIEEYRQLINSGGDNPLIHFKLARVHVRSKNYDEGIKEFRMAIERAPDNIQAHRELAGIYLNRGMLVEAEGEYRQVLRLKRDDIGARNAVTALLVKQKKYDDLVDHLKEGVELAPNDPNRHYKLGLIYDFKKNFDLAMEQYKEAISLRNDHAKALNALGKVYLKLGDRKKGREMLEAAKKADPNLLEPRELLNNLRDDEVSKTVKHRKNKAGRTSQKKHVKKARKPAKTKIKAKKSKLKPSKK